MLSFRQASLDRVATLTGTSPESIHELRQEIAQSDLPERLLQRGASLAFTRELPQAALLYMLVRSCRPKRVVETGVRPGYSTAWILAALDRNGMGELYSIGPLGRRAGVRSSDGDRWGVRAPLPSQPMDVSTGELDRPPRGGPSERGPVDLFFSDNGPDADRSKFELRNAWGAMGPVGSSWPITSMRTGPGRSSASGRVFRTRCSIRGRPRWVPSR